jgi:hypothetical protein
LQPQWTPRRMGSGMLSKRMQKQERSPVVGNHKCRKPGYKPQGEILGDTIGEVG